MKFTYRGEDVRDFPSLGITLKPNDSFDAPDDFSAANVTSAKSKPVVGEKNDTSTTLG